MPVRFRHRSVQLTSTPAVVHCSNIVADITQDRNYQCCLSLFAWQILVQFVAFLTYTKREATCSSNRRKTQSGLIALQFFMTVILLVLVKYSCSISLACSLNSAVMAYGISVSKSLLFGNLMIIVISLQCMLFLLERKTTFIVELLKHLLSNVFDFSCLKKENLPRGTVFKQLLEYNNGDIQRFSLNGIYQLSMLSASVLLLACEYLSIFMVLIYVCQYNVAAIAVFGFVVYVSGYDGIDFIFRNCERFELILCFQKLIDLEVCLNFVNVSLMFGC